MHPPQVPQGKTRDPTIEQRSVIIRGLAASAIPPDTDTARVAYFQFRGRCVGVHSGPSSSPTTPNYNSHEAGASAYLQAPYYEKLAAVAVYEVVVGSVTIPYQLVRMYTTNWYVHACYHVHCGDCDTNLVGPPVSASYSLRILYRMAPVLPESDISSFHLLLGFMHLIYSNCLASFLITLLLQHDSV